MLLDGGRKLDYPERTHTYRGEQGEHGTG